MRSALLAVTFLLAATAPALAQMPAAGQPLEIVIHHNLAEAQQRSQYVPEKPIDVHVTETTHGRVDAVALVSTSPDGRIQRSDLVRAADGSFSGRITLATEGTWNIALATRTGTFVTNTTPFTLSAVEPPPSESGAIGLAVGAGVFFILGGGGFAFLMMRARRRELTAPLQRAA